MKKRTFFSVKVLVVTAAGLVASLPMPSIAQITSGGKPVHFLWPARKSPFPIPKPAYLTDTSYSATDTAKNSWLVVFPASNPNGAAVVMTPGGGYRNFGGWATEGLQGAPKLNTYGITVFLVHYRVRPNSSTGFEQPCQMWDGQRAGRWVRAHAAEYGVDPNRVGVLGFSSGGHVASMTSTHFDSGLIDSNASNERYWYPGPHDSIDRYSSRPDFQALVYPMTTMQASFAYSDGRNAFLGSNTSNAALVDYYSNEKQVTPQTPPTWINWGTTDNLVNPLNSTVYRDSLLSKGVKVKTVPVSTNQHAYSTARLDSLATWLNAEGFLSPSVAILPGRTRLHPPAHALKPGRAPDALGRLSHQPVGVRLNIPSTTTKD